MNPRYYCRKDNRDDNIREKSIKFNPWNNKAGKRGTAKYKGLYTNSRQKNREEINNNHVCDKRECTKRKDIQREHENI